MMTLVNDLREKMNNFNEKSYSKMVLILKKLKYLM